MGNIKKFVEEKIKKYRANFGKYAAIGIIFSLLEIFFLWIFIDLMKMPVFSYTAVIVGALTVLKFYAYVFTGMMKNKFFGYLFVLVLFYVFDVVFIWLLVKAGLSAALSSAFLAAAFFILRFLTYDKVNLLKY